MSELLGDLKGRCASLVMDDINIYSPTFREHLVHMEALFMRARKARLTLELRKVQLCEDEAVFNGHAILYDGGMGIETSKSDAIDRWPVPKTAS